MGLPMLQALFDAGVDSQGFDIRPPDDFKNVTAPVTNTLSDFSKGLTVLISVVRDIAQTEDVLFGRQNLVETATDLQWIVISSTLSPRYVQDLRTRIPAHIHLIDAPMSGAQIAAREKRLSFMIGAAKEELTTLMPLFSAMGQFFHHMGPFGSGMTAKVLNNLLAASSTAMTRLVLDWGDQAGLDEDRLLKLIQTSSGQNWFASGFDDIEFARDGLSDDNSIGILVKDVASALDAAPKGRDTSLPQSVSSALRQLTPRK